MLVAHYDRDLWHFYEGLRLGLRRTARHHDFRTSAHSGQPADALARLPNRFRRDRAGVHHDGVFEAGADGGVADHLGFVGVEAAAECDDLDAHATAANSAGSKTPSNSNATGPVISTWSSFSRHSIARSPPGSVTVTLRPVLRSRAAATAAAHAAEPQAFVSPAPRTQVRTMMCSRDCTAQSEILARSGNIGWFSSSGPIFARS